jgi:hypothetical protein
MSAPESALQGGSLRFNVLRPARRRSFTIGVFLFGLFLFPTVLRTQSVRSFYVSPSGSPANTGSIDAPLDLVTALSSRSPARPGDTIWLRGGVYQGNFVSSLTGTAAAPIVVRQYPGERATLDAGPSLDAVLTVNGSDTWYWGFEVTDSLGTARTFTTTGDPNQRRAPGLNVFGPRTRFINMVVHDTVQGFGLWAPAVDAEIYGTLTYDNGVVDPNRGNGHGIYTQNATGTKRIGDVISFGNYATGMKAYAEQGQVQGYVFDGVTSFDNGVMSRTDPLAKSENLFVGTITYPADRITIANSLLYHVPLAMAANLRLGYQNPANLTATITNNLIAGGSVSVAIKQWQTVTMTGNMVFARPAQNPNTDQDLAQVQSSGGRLAGVWDANAYVDGTKYGRPFMLDRFVNAFGGANLSYAEWRADSGLDAHSTLVVGRPTGSRVFVRPNRYEQGRANITIYNWAGDAMVPVDLSKAALASGDQFEIRDAQNYFGAPAVSGSYTGAPVYVPMTGLSRTLPVGTLPFVPAHTSSEFGAFVLLKKNGGSPPAPTPERVAPPTVTPSGGTFTAPVTVTLADATPGALIHYTLDGTTPDSSSRLYAGPFSIAASATVTAIALKSGLTDSAVTAAAFAITPPSTTPPPPPPPTTSDEMVATPTFSPKEGSFAGSVKVTIASATPGAVIRYSINNAPLDESSPIFTGALTLTQSCDIAARAYKDGMRVSATARTSFRIQ